MTASPLISNEESLQQGKCCWHCKYYIRQSNNKNVDGELGSICIVDRHRNIYAINNQMNEGDKVQPADYLCNKFKFSLPPTYY